MTVAELIGQVNEQMAELQERIDAYDERAAIQQADFRPTTDLAIAALQRPERFRGEHAVARAWLRDQAPHVHVFIVGKNGSGRR